MRRENGNNAKIILYDLDIIIKRTNFKIILFHKRDSYSLKNLRIPERSCNMPPNVLYMLMEAGYLTKATAWNNHKYFLNSINQFFKHMISQGAKENSNENLTLF